MQDIYYDLGLDKICKKISEKYKFSYDLNALLSRLIYGRILFPSSKKATTELSLSYFEEPNFDLHQVYRGLEILAKEMDMIQAHIYKNSLKLYPRNTKISYYDCTNFFFEIEEEQGLNNTEKAKKIDLRQLFKLLCVQMQVSPQPLIENPIPWDVAPLLRRNQSNN